MQNEIWQCDRCAKPCEYEDSDNLGILLSYDEEIAQIGKLTNQKPYEKVCDLCGNDIYKIAKSCDKNCVDCSVTQTWGLSIMECLVFQEMHHLINVEKEHNIILHQQNNYSSEFKGVFNQFRIKIECEKLKGSLLCNNPDYANFAEKAWELKNNFLNS